ncbi:MAG: TolC family protein [Terriglobales bacterium]
MPRLRLLSALVALAALLVAAAPLAAQQAPIDVNPSGVPYANGRGWLTTLFGQQPLPVQPLHLDNSPLLFSFIHNGQLQLTLDDAIALALENNLDIAIQRLNLPLADADILRAKAGSPLHGVSTGIVTGTIGGASTSSASSTSGSTTATSAGASGSAPGGTSSGAGGAASGTAGVVTSELGAGPGVPALEPFFSSTLEYSNQATPESTTFITGTTQLLTNTSTYNFSYNQAFLTGTAFSVGFDNSRATSNDERSLFNPTLNSGLTVSVSQPLLAGFGTSVNGRDITIAKTDREISQVTFREQVESTVSQIEDIYWNVVTAKDAVAVAQSTLDLANTILKQNQQQVQIGTLAPISVTQEEATVATDQQSLIVAQTNYEYQQLLLLNAVSKNLQDPRLNNLSVVPLTRISVSTHEPVQPVQDLIHEALEYRPELAISRMNISNLKISYKAVKNELLPTLDLIGSYSTTGLTGAFNPAAATGPFGTSESSVAGFVGGYPAAFNQVFTNAYPTYTVGFSLQIPIFNHSGQADAISAQLQLQQSRLQQQQQVNEIIIEVRNAQYTLEQDRAAVFAAQKAVTYQQQTLDAARKEFALGATTITTVITDQTNLATAQSSRLTALANYQDAKVNLDSITGRTLIANRISIRDAENGHITQMPQARE